VEILVLAAMSQLELVSAPPVVRHVLWLGTVHLPAAALFCAAVVENQAPEARFRLSAAAVVRMLMEAM